MAAKSWIKVKNINIKTNKPKYNWTSRTYNQILVAIKIEQTITGNYQVHTVKKLLLKRTVLALMG